MRIDVTMRIVSSSNAREHHMARHRRVAKERRLVGLELMVQVLVKPPLPLVVTLTRIAPARMRQLDTDNLASGFKATRDAVATWLGIDDADPRVEWLYSQERGTTWAARIELTPGGQHHAVGRPETS